MMNLIVLKIPMPVEKYSIKCPYVMTPTCIVVHNTANDASAVNEIEYMQNNANQVSFHFAVDDQEAVQGVELNRNAWHAGDGSNGIGNRQGIAIEICYSKSGGERFVQAEKNAAKLVAELLREYGWGIDRVTKHQDYSGKYCPHRTLDMGWERFLNMVRAEIEANKETEDKTVKEWWEEPLEWAQENEIIYGDENGDLKLDEPCTRRQMLAFLYRLFKLVVRMIGGK